MNTLSFFLVIISFFVGLFVIIKFVPKYFKVYASFVLAVIITTILINTGIINLPLTKELGGGDRFINKYQPETQVEVPKPNLEETNKIDYKLEGKKALDSSLK